MSETTSTWLVRMNLSNVHEVYLHARSIAQAAEDAEHAGRGLHEYVVWLRTDPVFLERVGLTDLNIATLDAVDWIAVAEAFAEEDS